MKKVGSDLGHVRPLEQDGRISLRPETKAATRGSIQSNRWHGARRTGHRPTKLHHRPIVQLLHDTLAFVLLALAGQLRRTESESTAVRLFTDEVLSPYVVHEQHACGTQEQHECDVRAAL